MKEWAELPVPCLGAGPLTASRGGFAAGLGTSPPGRGRGNARPARPRLRRLAVPLPRAGGSEGRARRRARPGSEAWRQTRDLPPCGGLVVYLPIPGNLGAAPSPARALPSPPLPLGGGEEMRVLRGRASGGWRFLSPGQGERWPEGPVRGCLAPNETVATAASTWRRARQAARPGTVARRAGEGVLAAERVSRTQVPLRGVG